MIYLKLIIYALFRAYSLVLTIYCVSSWFVHDPYNKFMQVLSVIVDPVLDPVRNVMRKIPFIGDLPVDFSPIIVILLFNFVMGLL